MSVNIRNIKQRFWRDKAIPHLTIRTTHENTTGYKSHSHAELSIGLILSGETCLSHQGRSRTLTPGQIILIEPNQIHACNPIEGQPRSYHMLYIDSTWCSNILSAHHGKTIEQFVCQQPVITDPNIASLLSALIADLSLTSSVPLIADLNALLSNIVLQHCVPADEKKPCSAVTDTVKTKLLYDLTEPPSIKTIAQQLGKPVESVIRRFKHDFGITPHSFLNNQRIEKAKYLLKCGMNIVDVAVEVGYADQSHLHRAFVHYTAATPRQYQQTTSISDNKS